MNFYFFNYCVFFSLIFSIFTRSCCACDGFELVLTLQRRQTNQNFAYFASQFQGNFLKNYFLAKIFHFLTFVNYFWNEQYENYYLTFFI